MTKAKELLDILERDREDEPKMSSFLTMPIDKSRKGQLRYNEITEDDEGNYVVKVRTSWEVIVARYFHTRVLTRKFGYKLDKYDSPNSASASLNTRVTGKFSKIAQWLSKGFSDHGPSSVVLPLSSSLRYKFIVTQISSNDFKFQSKDLATITSEIDSFRNVSPSRYDDEYGVQAKIVKAITDKHAML